MSRSDQKFLSGHPTPGFSGRGPDETIICFAEGTMIRTPHGECRIEHLSGGDLVLTLDNGPQPVRWTGSRMVRATGVMAPIRFAKGTIGNSRDLLVSPQHRMLISGARARNSAAQDELLAPALALVDNYRVTVAYGGMVTYHHLLFDRHEILLANGTPSESFYPAGNGLESLDDRERADLFDVFPALRTNASSYGRPSRLCLDIEKARRLAVG